MRSTPLTALTLFLALAADAAAQNVQTSAVVPDPLDSRVVWVANRDNHTVGRLDTRTGALTEVTVGIRPRSLAVTPDGTRVLVANQRGDVPLSRHFLSPFTGAEVRGSVSVINTQTMQVTTTLTDCGVEPYGLALSPDGSWFAVSAFRSGTVSFYETATLQKLFQHTYPADLAELPPGVTVADADANRDGIADLGDPRGFVIDASGTHVWVTHHKSPYVSRLDLAAGPAGLPASVSLGAKVLVDDYPFDPIFNPVPVRDVRSQGKPRFLEEIALTPDGSRAFVAHVLHNVNHDLSQQFSVPHPLNRVYPALTIIDANTATFGAPNDRSARLQHEHADEPTPAEAVPYGVSGVTSAGDPIVLGALNPPLLGQNLELIVSGVQPGDQAVIVLGTVEGAVPTAGGTLLLRPRVRVPVIHGRATLPVPNIAAFDDEVFLVQALVLVGGGPERAWSNGLRLVLEDTAPGAGKMGHRGGHPSLVRVNEAGDHVLLLNRGSEDLFLYSLAGSSMTLRDTFPPRHDHVERAPLDLSTPLGDLPMGMALVPDTTTQNDDAWVYVLNEGTRTLSVLRVDYTAGVIANAGGQLATHAGADAMTLEERLGQELFEDASRAQTAGNFNNSCASCHFEGGEDGNVWQRETGPRSTMPVYGGSDLTGLVLWKGTRLHMGETGPMFAGENGGTGALSDPEQDALVAYHAHLPVPLNPNLDPATGLLTAEAAFGQDLFFGTNDTGLNPSGRAAGCASCHPRFDGGGSFPGPRFFTADSLPSLLTSGDPLGTLDPACFSLQESQLQLNLQQVNTGVNVDLDGDGQPEIDRNGDGFDDRETYTPLFADAEERFKRDDVNSYMCPCTPGAPNCDPNDPFRRFTRRAETFVVPTKLGVFSSGPYFHDHAAFSLRTLLNPGAQALDPVYGSPAFAGQAPYPGLNKLLNGAHDIIGDTTFGGTPEVQLSLQSGSAAQAHVDMEAILAFVRSL
ncbi:MAG: YncE family protein [Planctomycetota bacterium]